MEASEYQNKLKSATAEAAALENLPPESQASVQAISQPAPERGGRATTPPTQTLGTVGDGKPVPFSTPIPASTRRRARLSVTPSPTKSPAQKETIPPDEDKHHARPSNDQESTVEIPHEQQHSRSRLQLSDDEESEAESQKEPENEPVPEPEPESEEEEEERLDPSSLEKDVPTSREPEVQDEHDEYQALYQDPVTNPALQLAISAQATPSPSLAPQPQALEDDEPARVPGTYPDIEHDMEMDVDGDVTLPEAPSTPAKAPPSPRPFAAASASPDDPFRDLGTAPALHLTSEGGGRRSTGPRASLTSRVLVPHSSLTPAPSSPPNSNGQAGSHSNDVRTSEAGSEQPPSGGRSRQSPAMDMDEDKASTDKPSGSKASRRRRPSDSIAPPEAKRSRTNSGSPELSAPLSPASNGSSTRPPTRRTRSATKRDQDTKNQVVSSDSEDEIANEDEVSPTNGRHAPATPPPKAKDKVRATRASAREQASTSRRGSGASESAYVVHDSDDDRDTDAGPASKRTRSRQEEEWTPTTTAAKKPVTYARSNKRRKTDTHTTKKDQPTLHSLWPSTSRSNRESRGASAGSPIQVPSDSE